MLLISTGSVVAQTAATKISYADFYTDFKRCQTWYTATSYSVNINYKSFVTYTSTDVEDEFSGYIYQDGDKMKMFSMGVITVINENVVFSIDTSEAVVMIGSPGDKPEMTEEKKKEEEATHLEEIQEDVKSVSKNESQNGYRYEVIYTAGNEYEKVIIEMNKQYQLQKQILYFPEQFDPENNSKTKPRMEVTYQNFATDVKFNAKEFKESTYYTKTDKGYVGLGDFKSYEIFDTRVK